MKGNNKKQKHNMRKGSLGSELLAKENSDSTINILWSFGIVER